MIAVGIIGVLTAIAIPTYNNYINTSCLSAARTNLETLASFEENYNIENGSYLAGTYGPGGALNAFAQALHWDPNDKEEYKYTVATGGADFEYVITVEGTGSCKSATDAFGATEQGFHKK